MQLHVTVRMVRYSHEKTTGPIWKSFQSCEFGHAVKVDGVLTVISEVYEN